eukprot:88891_1
MFLTAHQLIKKYCMLVFKLIAIIIPFTVHAARQWMNCWKPRSNELIDTAKLWTNVTKDKLNRNLTETETITLPIYGITKHANTRPMCLLIIGASAVGKTSAIKFVKDNRDIFQIPLSSASNQLDSVIIDGDLWRQANRHVTQLQNDLNSSNIICKDFYGIINKQINKWKSITFQNALNNKQNIMFPHTLTDINSFLTIFKKLIENDYCIKIMVVIGDQNHVIQRGEERSERDHKEYDKLYYTYSVSTINALVRGIKQYPILTKQLIIVYNQHVGNIESYDTTPLPIKLCTVDEFETMVEEDLSPRTYSIFKRAGTYLGGKCNFNKQLSQWNEMVKRQIVDDTRSHLIVMTRLTILVVVILIIIKIVLNN